VGQPRALPCAGRGALRAHRAIVDLDSGKPLFTVEHEVRSATHPMFMRPMVNRNPAITNRNYAFGHDQSSWAMGPDQYDG